MATVPTACDVFAAHDAERPVASVSRIGGGKYRVQLVVPDWAAGVLAGDVREMFDTFDEAQTYAEKYATALDGTSSSMVAALEGVKGEKLAAIQARLDDANEATAAAGGERDAARAQIDQLTKQCDGLQAERDAAVLALAKAMGDAATAKVEP